jgi:hypothetical protein
MPGGFTFKVEGFEQAKKRLDPANLKKEINAVLKAFGENVARDAKQLVPVDEGFLKGQINSNPTDLNVEIVVNADYAAYVEFGTRGFAEKYVATLPTEWKEFAAKYKGPGGGSFDELVMRIFEWVKRKGIKPQPKQAVQEDNYRNGRLINNNRKPKKVSKEEGQQQLAYAIAVKIVREGVKPKPFLYPAYEKHRKQLLDDLNDILNA